MGIQTMGSQGNGQQPHLQPSPLSRQSSWFNLTLDEVKNQLGDMGKPMGSMNLDELLQKVWTAEANQSMGMDNENFSSASSLQRQASATLARALSGKTVDQVWREIQQGQNKRYGEGMSGQDRNMTLGEMTLEDFLVQAGLFAKASIGPTMELDMAEQTFPLKMALSSSPSTGTLSDTTMPGRKRNSSDTLEKTMDRKSAARSRARIQVGF
jgi:ABA responsive element binding factor